jgi:hypothetical protein
LIYSKQLDLLYNIWQFSAKVKTNIFNFDQHTQTDVVFTPKTGLY